MQNPVNKLVLFTMISVGSLIGMVKGEEAKQKWMFRVRSNHETKRLVAEKRRNARRGGGLLLDDIEMAAFHNL